MEDTFITTKLNKIYKIKFLQNSLLEMMAS